ncbi:hypothetical protein MCBRY_002886 [Methylocystis bryophila]
MFGAGCEEATHALRLPPGESFRSSRNASQAILGSSLPAA